MCAPSQGAMLPYGLKIPSPYFPFAAGGGLTQAHLSALDFQRSQINDYNVRVQLGLRNYQNSIGLSPFHAYITDPYAQAYFYKHDPRARFVQEEPKPSHSYIGLIGMAILNSKEKKLVLSDIYQWILDNYAYFRTRGPGWRNSIRHNLSLNDCFIKSGRSANGKGHYWAVHPANVEDFERGDFRRRRAQRKVRRHMGLSVPDDDDSPSPSPTQPWPHHEMNHEGDGNHVDGRVLLPESMSGGAPPGQIETKPSVLPQPMPTYGMTPIPNRRPGKRRLFDMASLLAPDDDETEEETVHKSGDNDNVSATEEGNQVSFQHVSSNAYNPESRIKVIDDSNTEAEFRDSKDYEIQNKYSRPSDSKKDFTDESDIDDDEIEVTMDDDSFDQSLNQQCDTERNGNAMNVNAKNCARSESYQDRQPTPNNTEIRKTEHALDLSSPESNGSDSPRSGETGSKVREARNRSFSDEDEKQSGENTGKAVMLLNLEPEMNQNRNRSDLAGHEEIKSWDGARHASGEDIVSKSEHDHQRSQSLKAQFSTDRHHVTVSSPSPSLCVSQDGMPNFGQTGNLRYKTSEFNQLCPQFRSQNSTPVSLVGSTSTEGHLNCSTEEMRRSVTETVIPSSEPIRHNTGDALRWAEFPKDAAIPRERISAFNSLSLPRTPMYPQFSSGMLQGFSMVTQRLLPPASAMRPRLTTALLPSAISSSSLAVAGQQPSHK